MIVTDHQCRWYPTTFYELVRGRDRHPRVEFIDGKSAHSPMIRLALPS